jgi:hypothetical protein
MPNDAEAWTGVFAKKSDLSSKARTGVYTTPDPCQICVVAQGEAYVVDAFEPARFKVLPAAPVMEVHSVVERRLLIFVTPWELLAWGPDGMAWRTTRLAIDGIKVTEVTPEEIRGLSDHPDREGLRFAVDLRTGSIL